MINIKFVYNSDLPYNKEWADSLSDVLESMEVSFEKYDSRYLSERKKGFKIKGSFGARLDPFVAIYEDKKPIKGFYTENNNCGIINIIEYVEQRNETTISNSSKNKSNNKSEESFKRRILRTSTKSRKSIRSIAKIKDGSNNNNKRK